MNPGTSTAVYRITTEWLREPRDANELIPLRADQALVLADAIDIADICARSCVESYATVHDWDPPRRYDLNAVDPKGSAWLSQAVRYLDARGLLEREAGAEHLVRVVGEAKEVA